MALLKHLPLLTLVAVAIVILAFQEVDAHRYNLRPRPVKRPSYYPASDRTSSSRSTHRYNLRPRPAKRPSYYPASRRKSSSRTSSKSTSKRVSTPKESFVIFPKGVAPTNTRRTSSSGSTHRYNLRPRPVNRPSYYPASGRKSSSKTSSKSTSKRVSTSDESFVIFPKGVAPKSTRRTSSSRKASSSTSRKLPFPDNIVNFPKRYASTYSRPATHDVDTQIVQALERARAMDRFIAMLSKSSKRVAASPSCGCTVCSCGRNKPEVKPVGRTHAPSRKSEVNFGALKADRNDGTKVENTPITSDTEDEVVDDIVKAAQSEAGGDSSQSKASKPVLPEGLMLSDVYKK